MQLSRPWSPPSGPLGRLSAASAARAVASRERHSLQSLAGEAIETPVPPDFVAAFRALGAGHATAVGEVAVIAEIKRASPSKGVLNDGLDPIQRVLAYGLGGASAISVITEPTEFHGELDDLRRASASSGRPCIRKDFIVDEIQLAEARLYGGAAALLIARALPTERLHALVTYARKVGLEPLVEVRDTLELEDAIAAGAQVIGVNNRNLETLDVDDEVSARLLPEIPASLVAVYESGVRTREDVVRAASFGADAVLVGSSLSVATDPAVAVRALTGIGRAGRAH
jgi:indole-3-glycerol phosphate synthase